MQLLKKFDSSKNKRIKEMNKVNEEEAESKNSFVQSKVKNKNNKAKKVRGKGRKASLKSLEGEVLLAQATRHSSPRRAARRCSIIAAVASDGRNK